MRPLLLSVVFHSGKLIGNDIVWDPDNEKIIIVYVDYKVSHGKSIVGTAVLVSVLVVRPSW